MNRQLCRRLTVQSTQPSNQRAAWEPAPVVARVVHVALDNHVRNAPSGGNCSTQFHSYQMEGEVAHSALVLSALRYSSAETIGEYSADKVEIPGSPAAQAVAAAGRNYR
ncbi:MAG: hypothetical protein GY832_43085 [Chloroflexi bacterium]|nr:hypothetical protein [Chloroflexota bacterium]